MTDLERKTIQHVLEMVEGLNLPSLCIGSAIPEDRREAWKEKVEVEWKSDLAAKAEMISWLKSLLSDG